MGLGKLNSVRWKHMLIESNDLIFSKKMTVVHNLHNIDEQKILHTILCDPLKTLVSLYIVNKWLCELSLSYQLRS